MKINIRIYILTLTVISCSLFAGGSIRAQSSFGGLSYRIVNGSGSWGLSMDVEHVVGSILLGGQFSYISYTQSGEELEGGATNATQIGIAIIALSTGGKWAHIGPEIGLVYGAGTLGNSLQTNAIALNYGVMLKLAFAAIPQSAFLSVDYAAQTKLGVGLTFPLN